MGKLSEHNIDFPFSRIKQLLKDNPDLTFGIFVLYFMSNFYTFNFDKMDNKYDIYSYIIKYIIFLSRKQSINFDEHNNMFDKILDECKDYTDKLFNEVILQVASCYVWKNIELGDKIYHKFYERGYIIDNKYLINCIYLTRMQVPSYFDEDAISRDDLCDYIKDCKYFSEDDKQYTKRNYP